MSGRWPCQMLPSGSYPWNYWVVTQWQTVRVLPRTRIDTITDKRLQREFVQ